jgi:hypothetical protein
LSPWISESVVTPDLLREAGFRYTLNWCHDDQPTWMNTRAGPLCAVPCPQELNDVPMILRHLRRALQHLTQRRGGEVWITTPDEIADAMEA